jgi:tetratricopeptide (TPR) repeat protein
MIKEPSRWEPELIAGMTTDEIVDKLKELVPAFDLNSFVAKTEKYISCEDLTEAEYYPQATFSHTDEDFIWMACGELWKRLIPDRPSVEYIAWQFDDIVEKMNKAEEQRDWIQFSHHAREALDFLCQHIVEDIPAGQKVRREFYEKLRKTTYYDVDTVFEDAISNLLESEEYENVIRIAGVFGECLGNDYFLEYKAESLFALGRRDESEKLYQEIISRNPNNPWFSIHAGDCCIGYGEKDISKAKNYYLNALSIAERNRNEPDGKNELRAVYQRLIDLAYDIGDRHAVDRYQRLLDSLEAKKVGRNDPCPCGSGRKYKKCCGREVTAGPQQAFDRRIMERDLLALKQAIEGKNFGSVEEMNKYIREINVDGKLPPWMPKTPLEQAQQLVYEALETEGKKKVKLAEQALKISADCADAYVLLAEEKANSPREALQLYEAGVQAGERALGKEIFEKEAGHFWGIVETRPYMRAKLGVAQCLWALGRLEEAMSHFRELLRLNPNDNQGVRYLLASALLNLGKIDDLEELLGQYDESTADWLFTKALVAFVRQGDTDGSRMLLKKALEYNPHVASYILGEKKLPRILPDRVGFGDSSEAVSYAAEFSNGWHRTEGAVDWLATVTGRRPGTWQKRENTDGIPDVFLKAFESKDRKGRPKGQAENGQKE